MASPHRMLARLAASALLLALASAPLAPARGQVSTPLGLERVADGFDLPVYATGDGGMPNRLYVVEQATGRIRIVLGGTLINRPFLDVGDLLDPDAGVQGEQGLLGMAFHPDFASNRQFFVNYTDDRGDTVIARYERDPFDPDLADPDSAEILLEVIQPLQAHNGGMLAFGPHDGMLYVGVGDGGFNWDTNPSIPPEGNAQSLQSLLGKILRLDVDAPAPHIPADNPYVGQVGAFPEIWARGMRNPWRFSFDRDLGTFWMGDVGFFTREEVNRLRAGHPGGANFGWRCLEGTNCTGQGGCNCASPLLVPPLHEYDHTGGRCAVVGGYAYRGEAVPDLRGHYVYGDLCSSDLWALEYDPQTATVTGPVDLAPTVVTPGAGPLINLVSFGEDADGELLVVDYAGAVYRLVPAVPITGLGAALSGISGEPVFSGEGALEPGAPGAVHLRDARPGALALMLTALTEGNHPFYGGILKPFPPLDVTVLTFTDAEGRVDLPYAAWPIDLPGFEIVLQYAIDDPSAVQGVALSNGLMLVSQ